MVTDVGVFQVADVPMYGYVYLIPFKTSRKIAHKKFSDKILHQKFTRENL